ncbi:MAG TPA: hypothetical protein VFT13_00100 [Candidatus Krumholzibacteria bacterium]|nr:hypothetical protein [Candidatus Krumholzibacteria bacterium]
MTPRILMAVSLGAIACLFAPAAHAESATVEFTPIIAYVAPMKSQAIIPDSPLVIRATPGTGYGARLAWWVTPRIAIEGGLLYAHSSLELVGGTVLTLDAHFFQADARVRVRLNSPDADSGLDFIGGIGITDLNDALSDFSEDQGISTPAKFTGIVGLGGTVAVSERVRLRFDAEDHIHGANFDIDEANVSGPLDSPTQHELVFSAGLVIPLWSN